MDCSTESFVCSLVSRNKVREACSTPISLEYNLQRHDPVPDYERIMAWDAKLKQTGSMLSNSGKHAKKRVSEENIELIRNCFTRSLRKSIRTASLQLQIPRSTVHNVVHKRLRLRAYKIQITQKIKHDDKHKRLTFAASVLDKIDENNSYLFISKMVVLLITHWRYASF